MSDFAGPVFPHRHVPLEWRGGPRMAGALELAAPLALGQRGLIVAPHRTGASTVLRWIGGAVHAELPDARIEAILIDQPVEDVLDWREELPVAILHGTTTDAAGPEEHAAVREPFERAAEAAEAGMDVVLLVDSLAAAT
ncbi:MAG: transcription termination factor Rho, partial [Thermoleophilia bacterium]|nr:transcription termination factor Rho [Thermoleophilia bacterium]